MALPRTILVVLFLATSAGSAFATHQYVVANNNVSPSNTVSIYKLSGGTLEASLVNVTTVPTGGAGTGGGYPANTSVTVSSTGFGGCVYSGDAGSADIAAMESIHGGPLRLVGNYRSFSGDSATAGGLGLIITLGQTQYLVSNYTGNGSDIPPAIGIWSLGAGCELEINDHLPTQGLNGGPIDSMALAPNGAVLVVAYTDGSVGSYIINKRNGTIQQVGQEMIAGIGVGSGAFAGSVTVSADGKWAIFGDSSATNATQVDVASIGSNGVLAPTTTYGGDGSLGGGLDTAGIAMSPDDRFIYVVNSRSGQVTTLSFDTTKGVVTYPNNCLTNLKDYNQNWVTASQVAVIGDEGTGTGLYVSEGFLTGDSYIGLLSVNSKTGCTTELPRSPFTDSNGGSLQSIAAFTF